MKKFVLAATILACALFTSSPASADIVSFSGSSGTLAASADFNFSGNTLIVTLTNTSAFDVMDPAQVLTALFFNINGAGALGSVSAVLGAGSTVFYDADGQPVGGVVGGEWGYGSGLAGPGGATEGISSTGLGGVFGGATFPGPDLEGPAALDGPQYGILSAGDNTATGNGGITGSGGLIKNSVVFTLTGVMGLTGASVSNVSFQYGTAPTEPNIPSTTTNITVPEPTLLSLLGFGLAGAAYRIRRRRQ